MKIRESLLGVLLAAALGLSACGVATSRQQGPAEGPAPTAEAMQETSPAAEQTADDSMPADQEMAGDKMSEDKQIVDEAMTTDEAVMEDAESQAMETSDESMAEDAAMAMPAWYAAQLTDVNTGSTFRVADFRDKVVLLETMAVWCSTCLRQQQQVQALHELLGERDERDDLISLALDIDPNETPEILKVHADRNGFDWYYAVAPVEVAREIGQLYGDQFLNPPSAPMLIIDRQGQAHPLPFGVKSAQALQEALGAYLS